ncbi:MAG: DsrE family protein [Sphingomonadaceae bacterium]|jgi:predicted peroxiredoxin
MPGLNIVILTDDAERFRGALTLALANRALGAHSRIFLQLDAVCLLAGPYNAPRDANHKAQGLPDLRQLIDEALEDGVTLIACQSGLALTGLELQSLDRRIEAGGPVSFLQALGADDQLIIA